MPSILVEFFSSFCYQHLLSWWMGFTPSGHERCGLLGRS